MENHNDGSQPQEGSGTTADGASSQEENRRQLGKRLRELRESAGLSKIALAQSTRISLPFLDALESGDLDHLPGEVFGRGFIKNICKQVDVDPADYLEAYERCWEHRESPGESTPMAPEPSSGGVSGASVEGVTGGKTARSRALKILAPAIIVLVVIGAAVAATNWKKTLKTGAVGLLSQSEKPQEASGPSADPNASRTGEEPSADASSDQAVSRTFEAASKQFEQVLKVTVKQPVRVQLTLDGDEKKTERLSPDTYRFTFEKRANLVVYDASALEVSFNGRSLGSLGKEGRVRRLSFKAKRSEKEPKSL